MDSFSNVYSLTEVSFAVDSISVDSFTVVSFTVDSFTEDSFAEDSFAVDSFTISSPPGRGMMFPIRSVGAQSMLFSSSKEAGLPMGKMKLE